MFRVSDALRDHPCWRVEGGEDLFYFIFFFFIIMGIRLEYACCFLLDLVLLSFCQSALSVRCSFLATTYVVTTAVLASTEKLPFSPLFFTFFFSSHLLFKKYQSHSSFYLRIYTINKAYLCFCSPAYIPPDKEQSRLPTVCPNFPDLSTTNCLFVPLKKEKEKDKLK